MLTLSLQLPAETLHATVSTVVAEYLGDTIVGPLSLAAAGDGKVRAQREVILCWYFIGDPGSGGFRLEPCRGTAYRSVSSPPGHAQSSIQHFGNLVSRACGRLYPTSLSFRLLSLT